MYRKWIWPRVFTLLLFTLGLPSAVHSQGGEDRFDWEGLGRRTYGTICAACHQTGGEGIPAAFPPLRGHLPELMALEGGRDYLPKVLLFGLAGPIVVAEQEYSVAMPAWQSLGDDELAAALNHALTSWGNAELLPEGLELYSPADISAARSEPLTPIEVYVLRGSIFGVVVDEASAGSTGGGLVFNDEAGYYTTSQAEAGAEVYKRHCAECHGPRMAGGLHEPPLTKLSFFRTWGGLSLDTLYNYIITKMPVRAPGSLTKGEYLNIVAHWLQRHNYPAGDQALVATSEALQQITIERR